MDIGQSIFEYGQTYVALSRIKSLEGLYLSAFHAHKIKANPLVSEFYDTIPPRNAKFYDTFFTIEQSKYDTVKILTDQSITDQSITDQSITDQSITDQSITDQSITDQSITDQSITDQSIIKKISTPENIFSQFAMTTGNNAGNEDNKNIKVIKL
jgi:hypothetical protein